MLSVLKNAWYAAAFSDEIDQKPFSRTLIENKMVLFRDSQGKAGIIADRCPHRFASLSAGNLIEDALECPYHGLRFDRDGHCIYNPHSKTKAPLPAADILSWPVTERYGVVWFWPGDAAKADPDLLPKVEFLEAAGDYAIVKGLLPVRGHYELVVDNLLDLSHAAYLHPQFGGSRYTPDELLDATKQRLERRDRSIINHRMRSGLLPQPMNVNVFGMRPDMPVHTESTMTWHPPALLDFSVGSWEIDQPRESGVLIPQLHIVTPETEFTSHYFYINGRNRLKDEPEIDQVMLDMFDMAFGQQDEPMIEMVQQNMGDISDITALHPVLLSTDAAPVSARRLLASLILEEDALGNLK